MNTDTTNILREHTSWATHKELYGLNYSKPMFRLVCYELRLDEAEKTLTSNSGC